MRRAQQHSSLTVTSSDVTQNTAENTHKAAFNSNSPCMQHLSDPINPETSTNFCLNPFPVPTIGKPKHGLVFGFSYFPSLRTLRGHVNVPSAVLQPTLICNSLRDVHALNLANETPPALPTMKWPTLPSLLTVPSTQVFEDAPLSDLPPEELEALDSLRARAIPILRSPPKPLPQGDPWITLREPQMTQQLDEMLLRFLRFNALQVDKTLHQLRNVLAWRANTRVAELGTDTFRGMQAGIPVARIGEVTEAGDALFFAPAECYDKKSVDHKVQEIGVGTLFEHMLYAVDGPGLRRGTVVVDFAGFSVRNVDLAGLRTGVIMYTSYYPDVFQKVLLMNYPKFMYGVWRAIAPLLDARTVSRIMWLSDGEELRKELDGVFPMERVPQWLGGGMKQTKVTLLNGRDVEPRDLVG